MDSALPRWIIKDNRGRIFGPFTNERLIHLIKKSVFTGEELIANFPDGNFKEISKIPQFYDLILESLAFEKRSLSEEERREELTRGQVSEPADANTSHHAPAQKANHAPKNRVVRETKLPPQQNTAQASQPSGGEKKSEAESSNQEVIELQTATEIQKKESKHKIIMAVILLLVGFVVYSFLEEEAFEKAPQGQITLLYPKQKKEPITEEDAKKQLSTSLRLFQLDTFSNYYRAMNILVSLIEAGYANVEAMSLLCLTHRELWPYAHQDSKDLVAISKMGQMASQKDPVGVSGATCRVVQHFLGGQQDGAASLTDSTLNAHPTAAAFYEFKSQILLSQGDATTAIAYIDKALQLWPKWLKLHALKAQVLSRQEQTSEAAQIYRDILKQNKSHAVANVALGEIEYFVFKHTKDGIELTRAGLELDRIPRSLASRGNTLLALQFEREQKSKEAIEYATKPLPLTQQTWAQKKF